MAARGKGVVLGAGVAGLAFAAAMKRHGHPVTLVEASPTLRASGSGLALGPTAILALQRIGLRDRVVSEGQVLEHGGLADFAMRPLSQDVFGHFTARLGEPFVGVERSTLVRLLAEAGPGCRLGARYVNIEQHSDKVVITLGCGEQLRAPWAVLADGIRSSGRDLIARSRVRDAGQWCWRGIADGVDLGEYDDGFIEAWGSEWRFGLLPVGHRRAYWFVTRRARSDRVQPALTAGDRQAMLLDAAHRFPPLMTRLIEATPADDILENRLEDLAPLSRWSRGRLICIGDAAHAMTPNLGQGATQALEDAAVLADILCAGDRDPAVAFSQFEAMKRARSERTVRDARRLGDRPIVHNGRCQRVMP